MMYRGTFINDIQRFSAIFDLLTMSDNFYPIRSCTFWGFLDPLTYPKIGPHLWTFPNKVSKIGHIYKMPQKIKVKYMAAKMDQKSGTL